jgi:hypothetical protein
MAVRPAIDDERAAIVAEIARKSLVNVLRASKVVANVRDLGPLAVLPNACGGGPKDVELVLAGEIEGFDLYSTYLWWVLYALLFAIPFAGTASVVIAILIGGPVASDHAGLTLRVRAFEARPGRPVGTYSGTFDGFQKHSIWQRVRVDESFVSHPEMIFQEACAEVVQEIARDRFWLLRFRRP